jgi:hypothetical protein
MNGHITPYWDIHDYIKLQYNKATIDEIYLKEYLASGHSNDQINIYNLFENQSMPQSALKIKENFTELNPISVAVNYLKPGTYLPRHCDLYKKWLKVFNLDNVQRIQRIIVMLQDNVPGQYLEIDNTIINNWNAGDWFSWTGKTSHAVYNFSNADRYALQITGYK